MPIQMPNIIGMPPKSIMSDGIMQNSLPVLEITPGAPAQVNTLTTFVFSDRLTEYLTILEAHGFTFEDLNVDSIKVAIIPDNFPSDTFTNEYSENFLQKMGEVASESIGQLAQMTGSRTGSNTVKQLGGALRGLGMEDIGKGVQDVVTAGQEKVRGMSNKGFEGAAKQMINMADALMGGARIDMPQLWKNSTFSPSYSFTVRLFNPDPGNDAATKKFIIGPIAALLLLSLPHAQTGGVYNWPYIHKINCPGMFLLSPAYISSINIIKGGDQQQIAWNQRMGIVDIRLDFSSLFSSIVVETKKPGVYGSTRPTLANYLSSLEDYREIYDPHEDPVTANMINENEVLTPITTTSTTSTTSTGYNQDATNRVDTTKKDMANTLTPPVLG